MVGIFNFLIKQVGLAISAVLMLLPDTPFNFDKAFDNQILGLMNYFLPVQQAVAHLVLYVTAVSVYYGLRVLLRWLKVASN